VSDWTSRACLRIIPRLDIKGPNVVKGVHLEGLRIVGKPEIMAPAYYQAGADELVYMDIVASLYGRNNLLEIVERTAGEIQVPLTVGGGVRSIEDIRRLLRVGADKVAINTAAVKRPEFVSEAARLFGSQCIVLSIEAKAKGPSRWEALTDNGRERTGLDALDWARRGAELGAGEILLTSVDREGTQKGFDLELTALVSRAVPVPVIACGGAGSTGDILAVVREGAADAVCLASILHYRTKSIREIKSDLHVSGMKVRQDELSIAR